MKSLTEAARDFVTAINSGVYAFSAPNGRQLTSLQAFKELEEAAETYTATDDDKLEHVRNKLHEALVLAS